MLKHIYVDGLNVQKMVEDLGYLILKNVSRTGMPIDEICNDVERSNHLKMTNQTLRRRKFIYQLYEYTSVYNWRLYYGLG
jgi:hypothetical protein